MAKMCMMNVMVVDEDGNKPVTTKTLMMSSESLRTLMASDLVITTTGRIVKSRHTAVTNHLTAATPPEPPTKPNPPFIGLSVNTRVLDI